MICGAPWPYEQLQFRIISISVILCSQKFSLGLVEHFENGHHQLFSIRMVFFIFSCAIKVQLGCSSFKSIPAFRTCIKWHIYSNRFWWQAQSYQLLDLVRVIQIVAESNDNNKLQHQIWIHAIQKLYPSDSPPWSIPKHCLSG